MGKDQCARRGNDGAIQYFEATVRRAASDDRPCHDMCMVRIVCFVTGRSTAAAVAPLLPRTESLRTTIDSHHIAIEIAACWPHLWACLLARLGLLHELCVPPPILLRSSISVRLRSMRSFLAPVLLL